MLITTSAIILKSVKYSDTRSIVHCYTDRVGALSFGTTHSSRNGRTRALRTPLSIHRLTLDYRQGRAIQTIRESSIDHVPTRTGTDPIANAIGLFIIELFDKILQTEISDQALYDFIVGEIKGLEEVENSRLPNYHLRLMTALSWQLGIMPDPSDYREGDILLIEEGRYGKSLAMSKADDLSRSASFLYRFYTDEAPLDIPMNRDDRNKLLDLLLHYYDEYFPGIAKLKSPAILKVLF